MDRAPQSKRKPGAFAFSYLWMADLAPDAVPTRERGLSTLMLAISVFGALWYYSSRVGSRRGDDVHTG
jgi:hypothetical protein